MLPSFCALHPEVDGPYRKEPASVTKEVSFGSSRCTEIGVHRGGTRCLILCRLDNLLALTQGFSEFCVCFLSLCVSFLDVLDYVVETGAEGVYGPVHGLLQVVVIVIPSSVVPAATTSIVVVYVCAREIQIEAIQVRSKLLTNGN